MNTLTVALLPHHSRRAAASLAAVALSLACLPPAATAQRGNAPPGNSGIQEYVETIPTGAGKRATNDAGHAVRVALPESGIVSAATRRELGALGERGRGAAALAEATAPQTGRAGNAAGDGGSALDGLVRTATGAGGAGGMGVILPAALLAALGLAIGYGLARRRAAS